MFQSIKYSNLFLRLGLSAVFIWFGIDKFINPQYWLSAWVPQDTLQVASKFGISGLNIIYISAVFELLVGTGVLTNMFTKTFSFLAILFLLAVFFKFGINEVIIRDLGLIGGFLALLFWPEVRRY